MIIVGCLFLFISQETSFIVLGLMLIGSLMAISSVSTMTVPVIVGQIANKMSFGIFPYVIAICIAVLTTAYSFLYRSMIEAGT